MTCLNYLLLFYMSYFEKSIILHWLGMHEGKISVNYSVSSKTYLRTEINFKKSFDSFVFRYIPLLEFGKRIGAVIVSNFALYNLIFRYFVFWISQTTVA